MNRANKSIGWCDWTWNPIKGICPVGCKLPNGKVYCYGRRNYRRFKLYPEKRFSLLECAKPLHLKKPSKIFVCSTFELFHPIITDRQRELIFRVIKKCPQHTFQVLTKFPQNIDRSMPDNVWLGVSVTENRDIHRVKELLTKQAKIRFVSIEPFLRPIYVLSSEFLRKIDWIILGRLTGHGKKQDPPRTWIEGFEAFAKAMNIPIFLKDNLKEIWGEPLIQEVPK